MTINDIRSKTRMTKTEGRSTLMKALTMTLPQRLQLRAALQRLPEPRRSGRSTQALRPRPAQLSGPPTT